MAILEAVFADKQGQTPQDIERRRRIAKELLAQSGGAEPIRSPWQGAAKIAQALVGGYEEAKADRDDASNRTAANKSLIDAVYGSSSGSAPSFNSQVAATSPSDSAPSSGSSSYRDAIASIESKGSGDYGAVGPTNAKMGRALGRYQIMEANIPAWSREALGREVSAEDFMKNPQIQDAIFDHRFGQYVNQFGPEGAAQAWFAGPGGVGKTDRKDVLGTSVGEYGNKFAAALGAAPATSTDAVNAMAAGGATPQPTMANAYANGATAQPAAQSAPQGIPAEFAGSQQLANARGGIVPALMGGTAASPEQVAQARALGASQPQPQPQGQDNRALIAELLGNPYTAEAGQQLLMQEMQRRQEASDPLTQLKIRQAQAEAQGQWQKLSDTRLFNPVTGETRDIPLGANAAPSDLGLNPQYGVDNQGNPVLIQIGKDGKAVQTKLPEGVTLSKEPIKLDAGTHFVLLDPITRQPVGQIPKENRQEAFDKGEGAAAGKAAAETTAQLPQTLASAEKAIADIDAVINDPNLGNAVGMGGVLPAIPNTAQAGTVARIEQLQGQAFLQAFESLKGGGQITEVEGKKATDAIARLSRVQNKEDFTQALKDLRAVVQSGLDRAKARAGGQAQPQDGSTSDIVPEGVDADDWKYMTPEERKLFQ